MALAVSLWISIVDGFVLDRLVAPTYSIGAPFSVRTGRSAEAAGPRSGCGVGRSGSPNFSRSAAACRHIEYGEQVGGRVLEGYPIEPPPGRTVIWDEASVGLVQIFLEAGYEVVASPTLRRRVVRRRLGNHS